MNAHKLTKSRLVSSAIAAFLLVTQMACGWLAVVPPTAADPTPVVEPVYGNVPLSPQQAGNMLELDRLSWEDTSPVAAITFNREVSELLTVQVSGYLRRTSLQDGTTISYTIAPANIRATVFDNAALLVATASGSIWAGAPRSASHIEGIQVWKTTDGTLYRAVTTTVAPSAIALSPDGEWLVWTQGSGADVYKVREGKSTRVSYIMMDSGASFAGMDAVAFDTRGKHLAFGDRSGLVRIETFQEGELVSPTEISTPGRKESVLSTWSPLAIAFAPTRQWLALVTSEHLFVYDLQRRANHLFVDISNTVLGEAALAFNPEGSLLAVGTSEGWQIWDVEHKKKIIENRGAPAYALTFSADGRLFAYGGAKGVVHVWGVRSP